jgi:hypothetical protein
MVLNGSQGHQRWFSSRQPDWQFSAIFRPTIINTLTTDFDGLTVLNGKNTIKRGVRARDARRLKPPVTRPVPERPWLVPSWIPMARPTGVVNRPSTRTPNKSCRWVAEAVVGGWSQAER